MKLSNCYWLCYSESEQTLRPALTVDFVMNRANAVKSINRLAEEVREQKKVCAALWDINDCQTDKRFRVPDKVWRENYIKLLGLKTELKREADFLKMCKVYRKCNSIAQKIADDLNEKYKDKFAKNYGVAQREFRERLKVVENEIIRG